jgi:hypothetical protein
LRRATGGPVVILSRVTNGDWPAPEPQQERSRLPLPRVDDLPVAEQGYDREAVREAFDAFYRHAAQLDATLRTLEAVEVFQRTASELRAEMRTIRAAGWTVSSYGRGGYGGARGGGSGVREWSLPPAFPRVAAEAIFLIVIGTIVGIAGWSQIAIVLVMSLALAIVWLVEFVASRERAIPRATAAPAPPKLDEDRPELVAAAAAAEERDEGPDAITILGEPERAEAAPEAAAEEEEEGEPEPEPQPEPEPEPVLEPEASEAEPEPASAQVVQAPDVEPEPSPAADADLAAASIDAGDEIDEAPEAERAEELVAQSHKVEDAQETAAQEGDHAPETELVAQSHKVEPTTDVEGADELEEAPVVEEDTLSGIEPLAIEPERRRFRLFRRGRRERAEAASEPEAEPEREPEPEPEPAQDPWVVPTSERPADADAPEAAKVAAALDPWERGPELELVEPEPEVMEVVVEPEPEPEPEPGPEPERPSESEDEPKAVELVAEPETEQPEPDPDLPVEVLAEQAAAALDRSRARRRTPRRARRR